MSSATYYEMKISFNDLSDISSEDGCSDHDRSPSNQQLIVLPPVVAAETGCSRFMLPEDGWIVKAVPRPHAAQVDKYYCESGTGKTFRSCKEVERYIKGEVIQSKRSRHSKCITGDGKRSRYSKYIMHGGKAIKFDEEGRNKKQPSIVKFNAAAGMSTTNLPDGWVIENVPRKSYSRGSGSSYKQYYEPGTGRRFRSLVEVQRHLDEDIPLSSAYIKVINEDAPQSMYHKKKDFSRKRKLTGSCDSNGLTSSFSRPCKEVKWILGSSSDGDVWYPFSIEIPVLGSVKWVAVPGCLKQHWNRRFLAVMNGDN